jgi:hypothetical protein
MAVWNVGMYSRSITESSKSILIEVLRILGRYRDYVVLTGGWAPYFILEKFGEGRQHCGSIDIDFVLNPRLIDLKVYETIVSLIEKRVYKPTLPVMERCFLTGFIAASSRLSMAWNTRLKLILLVSLTL